MTDSILPRRGDVALVLIDIQERLVPAMSKGPEVVRACQTLIALAREFDWPIVVSEQYPKGLGPTVPELEQELEGGETRRFEKLKFSLASHPDFADNCMRKLPNNIVVAGLETHVCVLQTVAELQNRGYQCFVPLDAVSSRTEANYANGLELMRASGATVVNVESLVFHALEEAGSAAFKTFSKRIR